MVRSHPRSPFPAGFRPAVFRSILFVLALVAASPAQADDGDLFAAYCLGVLDVAADTAAKARAADCAAGEAGAACRAAADAIRSKRLEEIRERRRAFEGMLADPAPGLDGVTAMSARQLAERSGMGDALACRKAAGAGCLTECGRDTPACPDACRVDPVCVRAIKCRAAEPK